MPNFTPQELNDIKSMKQRVMHHVLQEVENKVHPKKIRWGVFMLTAALTVIALFFLSKQILTDVPQSANVPQIDFTQPMFEDKEGLFYLQGVTLGDSEARVVELLGESRLKEFQEDGSAADLILDYNGDARFYFYEDKLISIILLNTNEEAFAKLYKSYKGNKFSSDGQRFFYSTETSHVLKAEVTPMGNLYVYLIYPSPGEFQDMLEYQKTNEQNY